MGAVGLWNVIQQIPHKSVSTVERLNANKGGKAKVKIGAAANFE